MGYLNSFDIKDCTGCSACKQICTKSAITMVKDTMGFLYPVIDAEKCISCHKCEIVCPQEADIAFFKPKKCYAAVSNDKNKLITSASGGAFYAIVSSCDDDTIVFGAAWNGRSQVIHKYAVASNSYDLFRKSKYVQSDISDTYLEVLRCLKQDKKVIYTGTPCQIAGLKSFLKKDYDNLLLVDLICHGISSEKVLENTLKSFDRKNDKVIGTTFRYKKQINKKWQSKLIKLDYESGKEKILEYDTCGFLRAFDCGLILRPSCYECKYATEKRISDITIGDFWGGSKFGYDAHLGASLLILNTQKGVDNLINIKNFMSIEEIDYSYAVGHNACLRKPTSKGEASDFVVKNIDSQPFEKLIKKIIPPIPKWKKAGHFLKTLLRG